MIRIPALSSAGTQDSTLAMLQDQNALVKMLACSFSTLASKMQKFKRNNLINSLWLLLQLPSSHSCSPSLSARCTKAARSSRSSGMSPLSLLVIILFASRSKKLVIINGKMKFTKPQMVPMNKDKHLLLLSRIAWSKKLKRNFHNGLALMTLPQLEKRSLARNQLQSPMNVQSLILFSRSTMPI